MPNAFKSVRQISEPNLKAIFLGAVGNPIISDELLMVVARLRSFNKLEPSVKELAIKQLKLRGVDVGNLGQSLSMSNIQDVTFDALFTLAVKHSQPSNSLLKTASTYRNKAIRDYATGRLNFRGLK